MFSECDRRRRAFRYDVLLVGVVIAGLALRMERIAMELDFVQ